VRAGLAQYQRAAFFLVDQDPVRLNVTIPPSSPISGEGMIFLAPRQGLMGPQRPDHRLEFLQWLAPLRHAFQAPLEFRCRFEDQGRRWLGGLGLGLCLRLGLGLTLIPGQA
jgi:hypothetical protein